MPTNITAKNFELTDAIRAYIEEKTATFSKRCDSIIQVDVEVDKNTFHHNKGPVYHVRIDVEIPNELLYAQETREDLYASIDLCRDEIERQLLKYKTKFEAKNREARKTRRGLKSILTFWKRQ